MTIHIPQSAFFAPPAARPTLGGRLLAAARWINALFERALDEGCPDGVEGCHGSECAECAALRAVK